MADASGPDPSAAASEPERLTDAQRSLRAQMLATEHWSLLASRSTTQSEVLTRIAIFLTLVSAGLLSLGLLGNATEFRGWFGVAALGVLFVLVLIGVVTAMRVFNTATEDMAYVLAMNRLRGAYVDLDPGIERYFLMSAADDEAGIERTYFPFATRRGTQVIASSMMVILVVETALIGLFVGSSTYAIIGAVGWSVGIGAVVAIASALLWLRSGYLGYRSVLRSHHVLRRTSTPWPPDEVEEPGG